MAFVIEQSGTEELKSLNIRLVPGLKLVELGAVK